ATLMRLATKNSAATTATFGRLSSSSLRSDQPIAAAVTTPPLMRTGAESTPSGIWAIGMPLLHVHWLDPDQPAQFDGFFGPARVGQLVVGLDQSREPPPAGPRHGIGEHAAFV